MAAFSVGALQMAQSLNKHIALRKAGKGGLAVPNARTSSSKSFGFNPCRKNMRLNRTLLSQLNGYHPDCPANHHYFGWRDYFDIYVTYRQLTDPLDTVWWVDRMLEKGGIVCYSVL